MPNIYPVGSDVLVQVKKGPISNKGPRITTDISLAGRYLVLMPFNDQFGISRKIDEPKERERLKRDKARTHVQPISQLGLMEMTRQRANASLASAIFVPCPHCHGKAMIKSPMTMSVELQRDLHSVMRKNQDSVHEIKVTVHPELLARLRTDDEDHLIEIERRYAGRLSFRADPTFHQEKYVIANAVTGEELRP